jgi:hypothetical protein
MWPKLSFENYMGRVFFASFPESAKEMVQPLEVCLANGSCADLMDDVSQRTRSKLTNELSDIETAYVALAHIMDKGSTAMNFNRLCHV